MTKGVFEKRFLNFGKVNSDLSNLSLFLFHTLKFLILKFLHQCFTSSPPSLYVQGDYVALARTSARLGNTTSHGRPYSFHPIVSKFHHMGDQWLLPSSIDPYVPLE